jgi:hypothetical protein
MPTVALAVAVTLLGCVLNLGGTPLQASGTDHTSSSGTSQEPEPGTPGGTDTLTVSGTISRDGRAFTTGHGQKWSIANRDSVKGYEGQRVTMKARVSPDKSKNEIHVMSVNRTGKKSADSEKQK